MVTTVTISEETRDKLDDHIADGHASIGEAIDGMCEMLPSVESIKDGCSHCDDDIWWPGTPEETGGVVQFFHTTLDGNDVYGSAYFCSPECAAAAQEEVDKMVPNEPDAVHVGGDEELRATFGDATFYLDGQTREVGLDVPGAFSGTSSHGAEYDYMGEPVYIQNEDGDIVQSGVIEDIFHEETHTSLKLGRDIPTERLNHPNPETREEYEEQHVDWQKDHCPACDTQLQYNPEVTEFECVDCKTTLSPTDDGLALAEE